jgi:hypothetical protein
VPFIEILPYMAVGGAILVAAVASLKRGSGGADRTFTVTWSSAPQTVTRALPTTSDPSPSPTTSDPSTSPPARPAAQEPPPDPSDGAGFAALSPEVMASLTTARPDVVSQLAQVAQLLETIAPGKVRTSVTVKPPVVIDTRSEALEATADWKPGRATVTAAIDLGAGLGGQHLYELTLRVESDESAAFSLEHVTLVPLEATARAVPGSSLVVRLDPVQPTGLMVDWGAP